MKKSYISIFLLFIVMILAISAVNAAEIDETSDSDALAVEETTVGEVVSTDAVDDIQTAAEQTEVLADPEDGNNFTSLQYKIDNSQTNFTIIDKNYLRVEGDNVIEINRDFTLKSEGGNIIDANNLGGIFKIKEGVTFVLQGITLVNGISDNGGAIYNEGHLTLNNSVFKDNVATIDGGAIYNSGTLEVDGCTFANNTANNNGGAIYTDGGQITLTHSVLDNNDVINLESSSSLDMGGAAIYAKNAQVTLTNTNVTNNGRTELDRTKGDMINGVLNLLNSTVTIAGGLFENNTGIYGGAILANGDGSQVLSINGATFRNNKAYNGGAIDIDKMTTTISDCTFENNWVVGPGSSGYYGVGGAVAVSGNAAFRLTDSNFTGNKATGVNATGGAVHIGVDNDPADIQNCVFTDNTAEYKGDAIYNHGPLTLSGNTVNSDVPGIYTVSKINTTVYVIVNDNQNGSANYYETIPVVVKITDDNGNIMTIDEDTITLDIGNSNNRETLTRDDVTGFYVNNEFMVKQSGWLTPSRNTIRKYFPNYPATPQGTQYLKNGYITMNKVNVTLSVNYENITYLDDVVITVNLTGPANAPKILVFNTTTTSNPFTLTVNDVVYKVRINAGIGTLTIPGLPVGEYVINASWAGNPNYNPIEKLYDLKVSPVPGTFTDLQSLINNAQNNVLDLPYNFTYNKDIDGDVFKQGVVINDYIVINGNGYTISGNDSARIFNITGNDITLNNMTLTNGKSNEGGAIYANGYDLKINNVIFKDNYADLASAIQFMHGYDLSITDCEFTDNHAKDSGTVSFNGHSLEITRTTFENNFVEYGAAAVRFYSDPGDAANVGMLTVTDSQFIDNKAGYYGAIEFDAGLACNIVNTNFTDNKAFDPDYGAAGAIYFNDGGYYLNIKDSKFIRNHASVAYGAIYFGGIKLEIEESDFINNTAELAHGAIFATKSQYDDTDVIIKNSEFKGNEPRAIYLRNVAAVISDTDFIANKAATGAAIYADNSNVTIDGGNFLDNKATQNATIFSNGYDLTVSNAFFKNNSAFYTSAIQFMHAHDLKINNCQFVENHATDSGAVSVHGHNLEITKTTFENNTAEWGAAAVRFFSDHGSIGNIGTLTITDSEFIDNEASYYGAILYQFGLACNIVNTNFTGNKATDDEYGMGTGIYFDNGYDLNIKDSNFIDNKADVANRAVYFGGRTLTIEGTNFINNTDGSAQAVVFVIKNEEIDTNVIIKNSKFEGNDARAIYLKDVTAEISNTDFIANKAAKGAAIYADNSNVTIDGGNFLDNNATQNATIFSNGYDLTVSNAFFKGNKAADMTSAIQFIEGHDLKITDCAFLENNAGDSGTVSFNGHNLDIVHTIFHNNTVTNGAAAVRFFSDPTGDAGSLTVTNCSFTNNKAGWYGAIDFEAGIACNIVDTYFVGNKAIDPVYGAAAAINFFEGGYYLNIKNSHFINNDAAVAYGAIYFEGIKLEIEESEFINNTAGLYGAIFVMSGQYATGEAIIKNSKFENNKQGTTPNSIVVFNANLYLEGNTINTDYAEIINAGNITSEVTVVLLNNQTVYETESYNLTAVLYDDQGNLIKDSGLKFVINDDEELNPVYDAATGVYVYESYAIGDESAYVVSASSPREANLVIKTGTILNEKANLTKFEVQAPDIVFGDDAVIFIDVYGLNDTGLNTTVTVVVNNTEYSVDITDGQGNLTVPGLENGIYPVLVHYLGSSSYNAAYASCVLKVLTGTNLTIAVDGPVDAYSEFYVHLELLDSDGNGVTGYVVLTLTGQDEEAVEYNVFINEGYADFLILTVSPGVHGLQAAYAGDDTYIGNTSEVIDVTVKQYTQIVVEVQDPAFVSNVTVTVSNITAANGNLTVTINGKEYEVIAVNDNTVSVTLNAEDIIAGENTLKVEYSGDETYSSDFTETTFTPYGNVVTNDTFFVYFDEDGVLKETVPYEELIFEGEFADLGVNVITLPKTVTITGDEAVLTDIGLAIKADNVKVNDIKFVANGVDFTSNDGAVVYVSAENVELNNVDIEYAAPSAANAFAVHANDADGFKLASSEIKFIGNDENTAIQHGLRVVDSNDVLIEGNTIDVVLPARNVDNGVGIDQDHVLAVGIQNGDNVTFTANKVTTTASVLESGYPTLDSVMVSGTNNLVISYNNITQTDLENTGVVAYYNVVDLYSFTGVVEYNNIVVNTTTGLPGSGTAYTIQMNGPFTVTVSNNNLTAVSKGPAAGIMTANWGGGSADLTAEFNNIHVTGSADPGDWNYGLTTGIEIQVNVSKVYNNTVVAKSVEAYSDANNIFGISNYQHSSVDSVDIRDNTVYSDGKYAVTVDHAQDSTISDNLLFAHDLSGDDAVNNGATIKNNYPTDANISVSVENITVGETAVINIAANELINGNVTVIFNGEEKSVVLTNGIGSFNASGLAASNYTVTVVYGGDEKFLQSEANATFEVSKCPAPELTITIGDAAILEPVNVTVSLPGVSGPVTIIVDGAIDTVTLNDEGVGTYIIDADKVTAGNHTVQVVFGGNGKFEGTYSEANFTVNKPEDYEFDVNLTVDEISIDDNLTIDVTLPHDANGNITVTVNGEEVDVVAVKDGNATVTIAADKFKAGNNTICVSYGDDKYGESTVEKTVKVDKLASDLTASAENVEFGKDAIVVITLPTYTDGTVIVTLLGDSYPVTIVDGKGNVTISDLTENTYTAIVKFSDDSKYEDNETVVTFNVTKIVIPAEDAFNFTTPENSTSQVISVNLPENATGYLLLEVNGTQTFVPLENGKANVTVPNLAEGTYNATVTYTGDANYSPITATKEINVTSNVPDDAFNIPDSAKSDAPTTYSISLPSDATGYLEVDVDGTKYVAALNNGSASVTIPALSEGNHNVTVSYSGDSKYSPVVKTTKLAVTAPVFNLSENKNINVVYSAKATYKVLVTKDGKAVGAGESVTIKFNGKTYTAKTDAKGYATLKLNTKVKVKKYTVTATYKGITVKNTVKVTHVIKAGNKKAKKSKAFKLKVKTKKVNGKYLKGKKLKLKFKGKTYKAKISKKGVAKFTIKKNVMKKLKKGKKYKYTVIYGKDKVTKKIKIK